jgi:hypothetical protein
MSADSSDVDAALSAKLLGDATLMALMPDGVYFDVASKNATRFVLLSLLTHEDNYQFGGEAWEVFTYLVKAVALNTSGGDVKTAAQRIHTLLQDGTLSATGYGLMRMQRTERLRITEVDEANNDIRWQHRGGHYEVWVAASVDGEPDWTLDGGAVDTVFVGSGADGGGA